MKRNMKRFFSFKNSAKKSHSARDQQANTQVASVPAAKQPNPSLTTDINTAIPGTEQHIAPVQTHAQLDTTQELASTVSLSFPVSGYSINYYVI